MSEHTFIPLNGVIKDTRDLSHDVKWYSVELEKPLGHKAGQFVMVSAYGVGECAISVTSAPSDSNRFEMAIRKIGSMTGHLHDRKIGDTLGIRGPYGSSFDLEEFYGKDLLFVCGGLGLVPLRSLILPVVQNKHKFGDIHIVCGFRDPNEVLYQEEFTQWDQISGIHVYPTVDGTNGMPWGYDIGLVTNIVPNIELDPSKSMAVLCGPPVMYKFVMMELAKKNFKHDQIFVDLERRMHCGVGLCGHCQIENIYCCKEGPVFKFSDIANMKEAL